MVACLDSQILLALCKEVTIVGVKKEDIWIQSGANKLYARLWLVGNELPVIIMLPGLGFHSFEYEPLAALLAQSGFNCLALDYRGHGRSEGKRGFWTLHDLTDDAICAVDYATHRFSGKIHLFGNSLGAMVGLRVVAQDKHIVRLAVSNCPDKLAPFMLTPLRKIIFALAKIVATVISLRITVNHFYSYNQLIDGPKWVLTFTKDDLIADARRLSIRAYKSFLEKWDGVSAIQKVHIPVLIMQGKTTICSRRLKPINSLTLLMSPGVWNW
jgi:alpha-beta hydrolase superfamily lysophospholipase